MMLDMANSFGKRFGSIAVRSRTADVSSRPRSYTRINVLIEISIYIGAESLKIYLRGTTEHFQEIFFACKARASQGPKFTNGLSIPGHDKAAARIKFTHDATAVIAELSLADHVGHGVSVALLATCQRGYGTNLTCGHRAFRPTLEWL